MPLKFASIRRHLARLRSLISFSRFNNDASTQSEETSTIAKIVAASSHFDEDYYRRAAGQVFNSRDAAAIHYVEVGEISGIPPSARFNPTLYAELYPDARFLRRKLLVHYEQFGHAENRIASFDVEGVKGARPIAHGRPSVLIVTHDLSESGGPILAWNLAKNMPADWNVVALSLKSGPLALAWAEVSCVALNLDGVDLEKIDSSILANWFLEPLKKKYQIEYLIANTALTYRIAQAGALQDIPVIGLVHEFAEYIPESIVRGIVNASDRVVFSSQLTLDSAKATVGVDFVHAVVIPQGQSEVPRTEDPLARRKPLNLMDDDRFLIIGCGQCEIRKGVDNFVSAAKMISDRLGRDRVRFIWVGNGYAPDTDWNYSAWIRDQINRSQLQSNLEIIPSINGADLKKLYAAAGAMFLSSRLDPLPNVAIDAMSLGVPVVCFEKSTGIAEHLLSLPDGDRLVAPYLDIRAAADRLAALCQDVELQHRVSRQERAFATTHFSFCTYVERLIALFASARKTSEWVSTSAAALQAYGVVEPDFLRPPDSSRPLNALLKEYVKAELISGTTNISGRRRLFPGQSFVVGENSGLLPLATLPSTLASLRQRRSEFAREVVDLSVSQASVSPAMRTAIHIHAYFPDMLEEILGHIKRSESVPALYISVADSQAQAFAENLLLQYRGEWTVRTVQNRGRDIGPLLVEFANQLQSYDVVGHVHTKRSTEVADRASIARWKDFLYGNLIASDHQALDKNFSQFASNPRLGLLFPEDVIFVGWTKNKDLAEKVLADIGAYGKIPDIVEFPVGNMFFFRPQAILPIFKRGYNFSDFPPEPLAYDGTMLHAIERIWTVICESQGYEWKTTWLPGLRR